jgi:hypothetical protein
MKVIGGVMAMVFACGSASALDEAAYGVGSWPEAGFGNHRAIVEVQQAAPAVRVNIPWRRRDHNPERFEIIVMDAATKKRVENMVPLSINREAAEFAFEPQTVPGTYEFYYLPYKPGTGNFDAAGTYFPAKETADPAWRMAHQLDDAGMAKGAGKSLPQARLVEIQARGEFNRFDPMEVCATGEETRALLVANPEDGWMAFPEDRKFPIRMVEDLPTRWLRSSRTLFEGTAQPNEFYTFQVGLWAATQAVNNLQVQFSDLRNSEGDTIPASALRCLNRRGHDSKGKPFQVPLSISKGAVLALWFGVEVPSKSSGLYEGTLALSASGLPDKSITIRLKVEGQALADQGDEDLWRLARLRWLDSTIGQQSTLTPPFTAVETSSAQESRILNRTIQFAQTGLPSQITSNGKDLFAQPVRLEVTFADGSEAKWDASQTQVTPEDPVGVNRETRLQANDLSAMVSSRLEFDGYLNYRVTLSSKGAMKIKDVRLISTFAETATPYFMGLGKSGGSRPDAWNWKWDPKRPNSFAWLGSVDAGLQLKLNGGESEGGVPPSWSNQGEGGCNLQTDGDVVRLAAFTGPRELAADAPLELNFRLLITPFKPLDTVRHWGWRVGEPMEGITVRHLHHAFPQNPYINYPFLTPQPLTDLVKQHKAEGLKGVNLYYNQGQFSNHMFELWPMRSVEPKLFGAEDGMIYLGDKAVKTKSGGGYPWLMEHLGTGYVPSWRQPLFNGETDASLTIENGTRYDNFYLEGASWLIRNTGVDGIYFDGIGLDRHTMRRLTRIMHELIPGGGRRDAHLGNNYLYLDQRCNSANMYMEHFPYLDTLWIGEGFNYELGPDYWLVEVSGLPFGLPSDMLWCSGTKPDYFRGMLFGMGYRPPELKTAALWKFWDEFKIQDSQMLGWWDSKCPVQTGRSDIPATAYKKAGQSLVVVASWADTASTVNLKIDYKALGLDPARVRWTKPNIEGIQKGEAIPANSPLELSPNGGAFILIEASP